MYYVEDLQEAHCQHPDCDHTEHTRLVLHSRCHPKSPTWVAYDRQREAVTVACARCHQTIVEIAIAHRPRLVAQALTT